MEKRVVITGLGAISPIGNNVNDLWDGIKTGKCGIDEITAFQNEEIAYAEEVAKLLSVKLIISHGTDDLNAIVDFIRNL